MMRKKERNTRRDIKGPQAFFSSNLSNITRVTNSQRGDIKIVTEPMK